MNLFFNILKKQNNKKRILFAGGTPTNFIQFAPVYKVLKQDPRLEIFFSGMYQGKDRQEEIYRPFAIDKKLIIKEKKARRLSFAMYISPDHHMVGKRHTTSIQMFHTTSFRNFSVCERTKDFKHLFLIGPYMKRRFLESGMFKGRQECLEEVGMPQTDALARQADTAGLREKLKLDASIPTLLYAPLWVPLENFLKDIEATLAVLTQLECNLLIKMHHNFFYRELNRVDWAAYLNKLPEKNKKIRLINDFSIVPYMQISDLLVSDASAVIHQFSILDRPIVCMKIDIKDYKRLYPILDEQAYSNRAVIEAPAGEPLKEAILQELDNPENLSEKRQKMNKEYFYNIGSAAKCAIRKIYQFLNV